jgi:hypothetical protein
MSSHCSCLGQRLLRSSDAYFLHAETKITVFLHQRLLFGINILRRAPPSLCPVSRYRFTQAAHQGNESIQVRSNLTGTLTFYQSPLLCWYRHLVVRGSPLPSHCPSWQAKCCVPLANMATTYALLSHVLYMRMPLLVSGHVAVAEAIST